MKAKLKTGAVVAIIAFGLYFFINNLFAKSFVPTEFAEARLTGAAIAKKIVGLSNEALASLDQISKYDQQGNASEALILISNEVIKNQENHQAAINLASQLEQMARLLNDIKPTQAKVLATEAVSSEVALVSRLLVYNDFLLQLFQTLQQKFQNKNFNTDGKVQDLIGKINEQRRAINDFDNRFNQSLSEFDKIFIK